MNPEESINQFSHLFPEWLLCESLNKAISEKKISWKQIPLHFLNKTTKKIVDIIPKDTEADFYFERQLHKNEHTKWNIIEKTYRDKYWSLRPDFMIINETAKILFFIEAKGGSFIPNKTWDNPKELKYYEFLQEISYNKKGFIYLVPKANEEHCIRCINKNYSGENGIIVGYSFWEDIIEYIADSINTIFVDWLVAQSRGISILSQWQKSRINRK